MKERLSDLINSAERFREACEYKKALSIYLRVLRQRPNELFVRMKIGEILQDIGEYKQSNRVFKALAEHFMKTGLPMLSIVAMKYLQPLQPQLYGALRNEFCMIYHRKSERISSKTKLRTWDEEPLIEFPPIPLSETDNRVIKIAAKVASMLPGIKKFPGQLPAVPFLSAFDPRSLAYIIDDLRILVFKPNEFLMHEGEEGDVLHIQALGRVRVLKKTESDELQQLAVLGRGAVMGEISFLTGSPRSASIQSVGHTVALKIPRNTLQQIQKAKPKLFQLLRVQAVRRILVNVLRTSVLFKDLSDKQKTVLLKTFQSKHFARGDSIIDEGQVGRGLFLLLTGRAEVFTGSDDTKKELAILKEGDIFGEISLIMDRATTASVYATTQVHTLFLQRKDFDVVMRDFPQVKERITAISKDRLIDNAQILGDYSEPDVEELEVDDWTEQEISEILELEPLGSGSVDDSDVSEMPRSDPDLTPPPPPAEATGLAPPPPPHEYGESDAEIELNKPPAPRVPTVAPSMGSSPMLELDLDEDKPGDPALELRPLETKDLPMKRVIKKKKPVPADEDDFELDILDE